MMEPLMRNSSDRRFLAIIIVLLLAVTGIPYLLAPQLVPEGKVYSGMHAQNSNDWSVYLSYVEQVRQGRITIANTFSTEDDRPVLVLPAFIAAGLLARSTGLSTPGAFHAVRLALLPILVILLARVLRRYGVDGTWRWAVVLFLFAGGYSLHPYATGYMPFPMLFFSPHFVLAWILFLWMLLLLPEAAQRKPGSIAFLAAAETLLFLTIPFAAIVAGTLVVIDLAVFRKAFGSLVRWGVLLLPVLFHQTILSSTAGVQSYLVYNMTPTPSPWLLFVYLGLPVVLALIGLRLWRSVPPLILVLGGMSLLWGYLPIPFQERMLFGLPLVLAILASAGMHVMAQRMRTLRLSPLLLSFTFRMVLALTIPWMVIITVVFCLAVVPQTALSADKARVARWIREETPLGSHLFTTYALGNMLAGQTGRSVYVGYNTQTLNWQEKFWRTESFFAGTLADDAAEDIFVTHRIAYVLFPEHTEADLLAVGRLTLRRVLTTDTLTLYRVE